jgi:3-hydroxymyristoyl/3-hydroxydecanoyl-(acyl carrier protein) dehydratase
MPFPATLEAVPEGFALRVDRAHPAFEGHFPDAPILSGLLQVDWAIRLGQARFGPLGGFRSLEHLKFMAPIRPDEALNLRLDWDAAKGHLAFWYRGPEGPKSEGIATFAPAP